MSNYKCYNCSRLCKFNELKYECNCENSPPISGRGICVECSLGDFRKSVPEYHNLTRIHTHTKEFTDFWENLPKLVPFYDEYRGITMGTEFWTFTKYEHKIDGTINKTEVKIPAFCGKVCECCS